MKKLGNLSQIVLLGVVVLVFAYILNISIKNLPLSSISGASIEQSEVTAILPTQNLTITVLPTFTPGTPDPALATPTPINVEMLPTPQPGVANAFGRLLCNDVPLKSYPILLILIQGDSSWVVMGSDTDENGMWFLQNGPPGTYTIMNNLPENFGDTLLGTWEAPVDQITDFGDVDFASVGCES